MRNLRLLYFAWQCLACALLPAGMASARQLARHGQLPDARRPAAIVLADSVEIAEVCIQGNRVTKDWIILRELQLKPGDRVPALVLDSLLRLEANKVFNTNLFITSEVKYEAHDAKRVSLLVEVLEKWYTFPVPVVDVGDRNFNEWWQQRNRDLSRLVYGFTFRRSNFRGRNELLTVSLRLGFRQSLRVSYQIPYLNRKQTVGMGVRVNYGTFNNLAYQTGGNRLLFLSADQALRRDFDAEWKVWRRKDYYTAHALQLAYRSQQVADTVLALNPGYFGRDGLSGRRFLELSYAFSHDRRDIQVYPKRGFFVGAEVVQRGLGVIGGFRQTVLKATWAKYQPLGARVFFDTDWRAKYSWANEWGYVYSEGLGYRQELIRGYDLYVIDGNQALLSRNTLRFQAFDRTVKAGFIPAKQFSTIPLGLYPKAFLDIGYVRNAAIATLDERFANRPRLGWGLGLDVVTFYNTVVRLEYSMSQAGDRGLYFYWKTGF
jgi:outer membrane protein assembly factor BamA